MARLSPIVARDVTLSMARLSPIVVRDVTVLMARLSPIVVRNVTVLMVRLLPIVVRDYCQSFDQIVASDSELELLGPFFRQSHSYFL